MKDTKFENYKKMIDKKAWEVSKKTGVDFEELRAQGAFIYCYVLNRYDPSKSSFSTILYLSLNRLYEYSYYFRDRKRDKTLSETVEKSIKSLEISPSIKDLLALAKEKLEDDSYRLIEWLVNRTWEFQGRIKPCVAMVMRQFGWDREYSKAVWEKCRVFWNESGWALYC